MFQESSNGFISLSYWLILIVAIVQRLFNIMTTWTYGRQKMFADFKIYKTVIVAKGFHIYIFLLWFGK